MAALRRQGHCLPRWQLQLLLGSGGALLLTGVGWLAVHYVAGAGRGELPHPAEAWLLRVHGAAAVGGLFALGVLAAAHVPQGWRIAGRHGWQDQRRTGLALCVLGAALAASGYLLYYFAPESVRAALGWAHAVLGIAMAGLALAHRRHG